MPHSTKKRCQNPQDGDASQRNTAWWGLSLAHVLSVPKSVSVTGQVLLPCILMDVHCWSVCAIAKPQVSSMQFWYIFLFLLFKKIPLWSCSVIKSIPKRTAPTPSHRGAGFWPSCLQNGKQSRAQQQKCGGCTLCKGEGRVTVQGWAICLPRDVCGEDACAPWVQSVCVCGLGKEDESTNCNMAVSNTRYSGRIKFLYALGAEPWLAAAGGEVCTPWGRAAVSKWPTVCCTSQNPSLWIAGASFSAT